jgi:hypothetical protein
MNLSLLPHFYRPRFFRSAAAEDPPVSLTDFLKTNPNAQQDLDAMIQARVSRIKPTVPKDVEDELTDLRTKAQKLAEVERQELERKGHYDKITQSLKDEHQSAAQKWQDKEKEYLNDIRHDRCFSSLVVEATTAGAINGQAVAKLLSDRVNLDKDRKTIVLNEDGEPMFKSGRPVSIKELIAWHKQAEPWAYKAEGDGDGAGAGGDGSDAGDGAGAPKTEIDEQIAEAKEQMDELQERARTSGNPTDATNYRAAKRSYEALKQKKKDGQKK